MSEQEIFSLYKQRIKFIDVTDGYYTSFNPRPHTTNFPTTAKEGKTVSQMFASIDMDEMRDFLTKFTSFHTRYYKSLSGFRSAKWLHDTLTDLSNSTSYSVNYFTHTWAQPSVIARIEGDGRKDAVILSAHLDSVNGENPWYGRSPGADDDGSGTCI
jgi:bacterial leucyl aminopeptidase